MSDRKIVLDMNTSILPIINVGMYGSALDRNNIKEEYIAEYEKVVADTAMEFIEKFLKEEFDGGLTLTFKEYKIISPKFYNYSTDELYFTMEIELSDLFYIHGYSIDKRTDLSRFLREEYKSYDGFMCFMPSRSTEYFDMLQGKDVEKAVAAFIMWRLSTVGRSLEKLQEEFLWEVLERTDYMQEDEYEGEE